MSFPISQLPPKAESAPLVQEIKVQPKTVDQLTDEIMKAREAVLSQNNIRGVGYTVQGFVGISEKDKKTKDGPIYIIGAQCSPELKSLISLNFGNLDDSNRFEITPNSKLLVPQLYSAIIKDCGSVSLNDFPKNKIHLVKSFSPNPNNLDDYVLGR